MQHLPHALRIVALAAGLAIFAAGCSTHEVDTAEEWCEQVSGVDIMEKHAPFWALIPSVRYHGDEIRSDFVRTLNELGLKSVQNRTDRMAWVEKTDLHVINPGNLNEIDTDEVIAQWRAGIDSGWGSSRENCTMPSVVSLFDRVHIHTWEWDPLGFKVVADHVTTIDTARKQKLKDPI